MPDVTRWEIQACFQREGVPAKHSSVQISMYVGGLLGQTTNSGLIKQQVLDPAGRKLIQVLFPAVKSESANDNQAPGRFALQPVGKTIRSTSKGVNKNCECASRAS